jgi:O-antigen/teichoic acid export membrane protein
VWIGVGFGLTYLLRLISSMILTRLLAREVYGLMDVAMVFIQGLHMFADVGIGTSIIQSKHGDDPDFLGTAWTVQVVRGLVLWAATALIAWPVAAFYDLPILVVLFPLIGATAAVEGFNSLSLFTLRRRLARGRIVALEFGRGVLGLGVTLAWVWWIEPDVWALVAGSLTASVINMTVSHFLVPGVRVRFRWERAALHELLHFGKWIFVSTIITFLAFQADRLIVPKVSGLDVMGVYGRALGLAVIATGLMSTFCCELVFPIYSRMHQGGRDIRTTFSRVQMRAGGFGAMLVTGMLACGPAAVHCMFGDQFADAGWMLQFVAVGAWFQMLEGTIGASLLALGGARSVMVSNAARLAAVLVCVPAGYWLGDWAELGGPGWGGFIGMLLGFVVADLVRYLVVVWVARLHGLSVVGPDIALSVFIGLVSPAAAVAGGGLAEVLNGPIAHPKVQQSVVFLCQGALVVLAWGLLYLLWSRGGRWRLGRRPAPTGA